MQTSIKDTSNIVYPEAIILLGNNKNKNGTRNRLESEDIIEIIRSSLTINVRINPFLSPDIKDPCMSFFSIILFLITRDNEVIIDKNENINEVISIDVPPKYPTKKPPNMGPRIRFIINVDDFILIPIAVSLSFEDISGIRDTPKGIRNDDAALKITEVIRRTT